MSSDRIGLDQVLVVRELDEAELAAVAFLARYSGRTLEAYRKDLRFFVAWAQSVGLAVLAATRPHIELFRHHMEQRELAASTIDRRLATVCGLYRFAHIDGRDRIEPRQVRPAAEGAPQPRTRHGPQRAGQVPVHRRTLRTPTRRARSLARVERVAGQRGVRHRIGDLGFDRGHRTLRILGKGSKPAVIPLVPRTARTVDLAIGERREGPILVRHDGQRLDRRTAHRWVKAIGKRAGLGHVHPHMLRGAFIMAALDAGVPLRDVQLAARHADPRTTTIYDRRRENFDRHAAYVVVAFVAGA